MRYVSDVGINEYKCEDIYFNYAPGHKENIL